MNLHNIRTEEFARRLQDYQQTQSQGMAVPVRQPCLSRRQFVRVAAGTVVAGAFLGAGLGRPGVAEAHNSHEPVPIPGGTPVLGGGFHVFGPGPIDPVDAEPSTITDFNGFVGLAFLDGTVTRTNTKTGEERTLPFLNTDMRFMKGVFKGTDGKMHNSAFAFVWVDVFEPGSGSQIHDLNPTIFPPTSLFWTIEIPDHGVQVHLGKGAATMEAENVPIFDYTDIPNALFGGGPPPVPGFVSFKVVWSGVDERVNIKNHDPVYGGFAGQFIRNSAQMEWTATVGDYTFASAPLNTSSSSFAEIGHERNGVFFP